MASLLVEMVTRKLRHEGSTEQRRDVQKGGIHSRVYTHTTTNATNELSFFAFLRLGTFFPSMRQSQRRVSVLVQYLLRVPPSFRQDRRRVASTRHAGLAATARRDSTDGVGLVVVSGALSCGKPGVRWPHPLSSLGWVSGFQGFETEISHQSGSSSNLPAVARDSKSRWACAASASG